MKDTVFIDSDLLFRYFAINPAKKHSYETVGTSGNASIDNVIKMMKSIAQKQQMVCLSDLSVIEVICTLSRLNSAQKIPKILQLMKESMQIFPLDKGTLTLSKLLGTAFKFHTGDSLHTAFCIINGIEEVFVNEQEYCTIFQELLDAWRAKGLTFPQELFQDLCPSETLQNRIMKRFFNLEQMKVTRIE